MIVEMWKITFSFYITKVQQTNVNRLLNHTNAALIDVESNIA